MAKLPSYHGPIPNRAILDSRLSGTQLRLLALYGWHDRLSLTRDQGRGCIAANKLLCARLGCDYTTLLKLRKQLEEFGYLSIEKRESGRRMDVVRVIPDHLAAPETWPFDQLFVGADCIAAWKNHGETASNGAPEADETASNHAEKAGETASSADDRAPASSSDHRENQDLAESQYIPLIGETYPSEEGETYSSEEAQRASRAAREQAENDDGELVDNPLAKAKRARGGEAQPIAKVLGSGQQRDCAEAAAARGISIWRALRQQSPNLDKLPVPALLCRWERAFTELASRNADRLDSREREMTREWLFRISDESDETAIIQHAERLNEELILF